MAALTLTLAGVLTAPSAEAATRYSVAGGCYALQDAGSGRIVPGAERVRMQATTLGSYLLYRPDRTFLAAAANGSVAPAPEPSPAADWRVREAGGGAFALSPASQPSRTLLRVRFVPARGCAVYPEAELDATGTPAKGATSYGAVRGFIEGHMHWMTYEYFGGNFHCGRPWHPYGIPYALPDCSVDRGPAGHRGAAPEHPQLRQPGAAARHPRLSAAHRVGLANNLTYEGMYWRWVERAWASGLRLMVMGVNENRVLCELQANRKYPLRRDGRPCAAASRRSASCSATSTRRPAARARASSRSSPTPYEARRVINAGQDGGGARDRDLRAVRLPRPGSSRRATRRQVDRQLDEMHRLGVRSSLLLNKFDNPLTGVRFDSGPIGVVINAGNRNSAGSFWSAETCKGPLHRQRDRVRRRRRAARRSTACSAALGVSPRHASPPIRPPRTATRAG